MLGEPWLIGNTKIQKLFTSFRPFREGLESSVTNWMNKPLLRQKVWNQTSPAPQHTQRMQDWDKPVCVFRGLEGKQRRGETPNLHPGSQEKGAASVDVAASNDSQIGVPAEWDSPNNWIPSLPVLGHVLLESDWNCPETLSWKGKAVGRHPVCPGSLRSLTKVAPFWVLQFQRLCQPSASWISLCLNCASRSRWLLGLLEQRSPGRAVPL